MSMKKLYHFLFYMSYCLISKSDGTVMERASLLVSTGVFFIVLSLYFLITVFLKLPIMDARFLVVIVMIIGMMNGFLTSRYFVKTGRYLEIINSYHKTTSRTRVVYAMVAVFYYLGSFALFVFAGITLARYLHPW